MQDIAAHPDQFVNVVNENICRDGRRVWMAWTNKPVYDSHGQVKEILAVGVDITERRQAEENVRIALAKYKTLFDNFPLGITVSDKEGNIVETNSIAERLLGISKKEQVQRQINSAEWLIIRRDGTPMPAEEYASVRALREGRKVENVEMGIVNPDKNVKWIEVTAAPIPLAEFGVVVTYSDITDRIKALEDLKRSEHVLRLFIEHSPAAIAMFDREMRYIVASHRYLNDYDLPLQDLRGRSHYDVFPEIPQAWKDIHQRCLQGNSEKAEADLFPRANGNMDIVRWEIHPWYEDDEKIGGLILFSEVITERKQAENELRLREAELNHAQELAQMANWRINLSDYSLFVSKNYRKLIGIEDENFPITFDYFISLVHPDDVSVMNPKQYTFTPGSPPVVMDFRMVLKNGSTKWFQNTMIPEFREGILVALKGTNIDITDKKNREEEIRKINATLEQRITERTAELSDLYNNAPCGYHSLDALGIFEIVNDTELNWLGYTREELIGKICFTDIITEESKRIFENNFENFKKRGYVNDLEFDIIRKNGSIISVLLSATAIKDNHGNYVRSRSTMIDHSERKKAEESLKEALLNLEIANKELEAFSYSVSHDLRAPLRAIGGFARILTDDYGNQFDDEGKRICNIILSNSNKMGRLIDDLLAFSRYGRSVMNLTRINMEPIIRNAIEELTTPESLERIRFTVGPLPEVNVDVTLIKQVWMNLISNAIKYTSQKNMAVIEISSAQGEKEIVFKIRDNGTGFEMLYVNKLFGVFQRLHTDKEFEGTGVGLAIVKRIINRHGGQVWAEGKVNEGAEFSFTLPK